MLGPLHRVEGRRSLFLHRRALALAVHHVRHATLPFVRTPLPAPRTARDRRRAARCARRPPRGSCTACCRRGSRPFRPRSRTHEPAPSDALGELAQIEPDLHVPPLAAHLVAIELEAADAEPVGPCEQLLRPHLVDARAHDASPPTPPSPTCRDDSWTSPPSWPAASSARQRSVNTPKTTGKGSRESRRASGYSATTTYTVLSPTLITALSAARPA